MIFPREDPSRVDYPLRGKGFLDVAYRGFQQLYLFGNEGLLDIVYRGREALHARFPREEVERGRPDYINIEGVLGRSRFRGGARISGSF